MREQMSEGDVISTQKALGLLVDLSQMGTKSVTFLGSGEPLLHKDIVPIMQRALDENWFLAISSGKGGLTGGG